MKLLIAGSRSITDFDLTDYIPEDVDTIISGGAKGVDRLAENFADTHRLSKYIIRPKYNLYGKAAPHKPRGVKPIGFLNGRFSVTMCQNTRKYESICSVFSFADKKSAH